MKVNVMGWMRQATYLSRELFIRDNEGVCKIMVHMMGDPLLPGLSNPVDPNPVK